MSIPLLRTLDKHHMLVDRAARTSTIVVPSQLDFMPGPQHDLESMIWVLTYAILLRHQERLRGSDKAYYKREIVDQLYGSLSYSGLAREREVMASRGSLPFTFQPEEWIPDPAQCK